MEYPHNIFWSDIPKDAKIYDLGQSWVVHMPDGRKGLVYWTGQDATKAQNMLKMRALPKEKLPGPSPNLPNFRNTVKTQKKSRDRCRECGAFLPAARRDRNHPTDCTTVCTRCGEVYED